MSEAILRGLTWNYRRATEPLAAASARFAQMEPGARIDWEVQSLGGFSHAFGPEMVDTYDLVIFDHPYVGAIVRDELLRPLTGSFDQLKVEDFIGPSLTSYRYAGKLWGLPIDAATQVAVYRAELVARHGAVPVRWGDVIALGRAARAANQWLGLSCVDVTAIGILMALCANLSAPLSTDPLGDPYDRVVLRAAISHLREILQFVDPDTRKMNPIGLHNAMGRRDDIVYCPLMFGFLTYGEADHPKPLKFADFAGPGVVPAAGTMLGGTGLGITRSCRNVPMAKRFAAMLADGDIQRGVIGLHHGQPAHIAAWNDPALDARFGGAYSGTIRTMQTACVRPRFANRHDYHRAAGRAVTAFSDGELGEVELANRLEELWWKFTLPL